MSVFFNELIFILQSTLVGVFALVALRLGKSSLVAFISVVCILANLFVLKQTTLFGFTATCSDAFSIGAVLGLNLLQEYYGKAAARKAIWTSFMLLIFYATMSLVHLLYLPHVTDSAHGFFYKLLNFMPRIVIASFAVYLLVQYLDSWLFGRLRIYMAGKYLVMRTLISIAITQFIDTALFSFAGLYGIVDNLSEIILVSYSIKLTALALTTPCVALAKWLVFTNEEKNLELQKS